MKSTQRNFNTITPSALSLLVMKSFTSIPFAKEAADFMVRIGDHPSSGADTKDMSFWIRAMHFENRYWSVSQLLEELDIPNVLELSAGYSFRGLDMVTRRKIHYVDTDLDEVIAVKKKLIRELQKDKPSLTGTLHLSPLNALDERSCVDIVEQFPPGKIVIVNEGLLMYLTDNEKKLLCNIISGILRRRGGYWITADIYIRKNIVGDGLIKVSEQQKQFFEEHQIEEKKFESFEKANAFFTAAGFIVEKEAKSDRSKLSLLPRILKHTSRDQLTKISNAGKIQATWRMKVG